MPAGVVNGNRTQGRKRFQIVEALALGETVKGCARRFGVSQPSIAAIRKAEFTTVVARKSVHAMRAEQIAEEASQQMLDELRRCRGTKHRLHPSALVPIYGVAIDKMLALRGDAVATIQHLHTHRMSQDDVYAFALERSKQANAHVVEDDNSVTLTLQDRNHDNPVMLHDRTEKDLPTEGGSSGRALQQPLSSKSISDTSKFARGGQASPHPKTHSNSDARARKKRRRARVKAR